MKDYAFKSYFKKTFLALGAMVTMQTANADVVIGLSPMQSADRLKAQVKPLLNFTARRAAGERIIYLDAFHQNKIASFVIPEGKAYEGNWNARLKAGQNGKALKALLGFVKATNKTQSDTALTQGIKLPQLMEAASQYQRSHQPLDVIALGSPFYHDPTDPALSMADGLVPSDGHLVSPRSATVFSANQAKRFDQLRLHMAYGNQTVFENDRHQYHVKRFWSLFTTLQGGALVSFAPDLASVLERVNDQAKPLSMDTKVKSDNKRLEMIRYRDMQLSTSIYQAPIATEILSEAEVLAAKHVVVGLTWHRCQQCDLDLYVRPHPSAMSLSYQKTKTAEGVYYKDFVDAPETGYETIELTQPVNLRKLWIAVNFYAGTAPQGVDAELRLAVNGKTYVRHIHLQATSGNQGQDIADVEQGKASPHTLPVNPMQFIKMALQEA